MIIFVVQCPHLKGTSKKTGNDYDFHNMEYVAVSRRYGQTASLSVGQKGIPAPLPPNADGVIEFPAFYDVSFSPDGVLETVEFVANLKDLSMSDFQKWANTGQF